jgi:hypothetical protein
MGKLRRVGIICLAVVVGGIFLAELGCRLSGLNDIPVYTRSPSVSYFMSPGQRGVFLNRNHWYVNNAGFNNDREFSGRHPYTLLVGDSIICGGNVIDYSDRAGTIAAKISGQDVWVAANGGGGVPNETEYLFAHGQALRNADNLVFVYDGGDLSGLTKWSGELTFPTKPPTFVSLYVLRRYFIPHAPELPPLPAQVASNGDSAWVRQLDRLLSVYRGRIVFILYVDKRGLLDARTWATGTNEIRAYAKRHSDRMEIVDIRALGVWNSGLYRDGLHPNVKGHAVLGRVIANVIGHKGRAN